MFLLYTYFYVININIFCINLDLPLENLTKKSRVRIAKFSEWRT